MSEHDQAAKDIAEANAKALQARDGVFSEDHSTEAELVRLRRAFEELKAKATTVQNELTESQGLRVDLEGRLLAARKKEEAIRWYYGLNNTHLDYVHILAAMIEGGEL